MKIKLRKIVIAIPALQKLSSVDLSLKKLYWVNKLINELENELKFYHESRQKIIEKYKESQTGNKIKIRDDCVTLFNQEINELLDMEVEVKFTVPEIPDTEEIKLSRDDIIALEGFVKIRFEDDLEEESGEIEPN